MVQLSKPFFKFDQKNDHLRSGTFGLLPESTDTGLIERFLHVIGGRKVPSSNQSQ